MHLKLYRISQNWHQKGRYYAVRLGSPDGELLVDRANDPEHAAARALIARGYTGPFEVYVPSANDRTKWIVSQRFKSANAASQFSVVDEDRGGLKLIRYRPGPAARARSGAAEALLPASEAA